MKLKRASAVGLICLTVVSVPALYFVSSSNAGKFSIALHRILESGGISSVDLSRVESFTWDELYVFGPYSLRESNCKSLSLNWLKCRWFFPSSVGENESILAFKSEGSVVHVEFHPRANGDFFGGGSWRPQPVPRSSAEFYVFPNAKGFRLEYKN